MMAHWNHRQHAGSGRAAIASVPVFPVFPASLSERPVVRLCSSIVPMRGERGESMASRPIHWHEGMFLRPQHFQAADRYARGALRESEDWFHPFDWGLKSVDFDREAFGNYSAVLRGCEARFKDGTKVSIPDDGTVDPVELK